MVVIIQIYKKGRHLSECYHFNIQFSYPILQEKTRMSKRHTTQVRLNIGLRFLFKMAEKFPVGYYRRGSVEFHNHTVYRCDNEAVQVHSQMNITLQYTL
jgi:hypothetical protein